MRRSLVIIVLSGIIGGIVWWLLRWDGQENTTDDPWGLLPVNTAVVVEVPEPLSTWEHFTSTSQLWAAWDSTPACAALSAVMLKLHDLASNDARWRRAADHRPLLIALAPASEGVSTLVLWPLSIEQGAMQALGPVIGADLSPSSPVRRGERISLAPADTPVGLFMRIREGVLMISPDAELLDDPHSSRTDMRSDSGLVQARASFGAGSDAHVLIELGRAQRSLTSWFRPEELTAFDGLTGWTALDVRLRPEAVLFSGLLFHNGAKNTLSAVVPQGIGRIGLLRVLPAGTRELRQVVVSDPLRFCTDILGKAPPDSLYQVYAAWAHGAVGIAMAGTPGGSSSGAWAVIQTEDPPHARDALIQQSDGAKDTLNYRGVPVRRVAQGGGLAATWGPWFDGIERPWWCALGDRIVFTDELAALRSSIDAFVDGNALAQDTRVAGFMQQYATDATISWWADAFKGLSAARTAMKPEGQQLLERHRDGWQGFGGALLQLTPEREGVMQITACLAASGFTSAAHAASAPGSANALWSVALDRRIVQGPWLVTDHLSRTKQVLVQDDQNALALVSCTGKVLWKVNIDGPILGGIAQVDKFRNGKLQRLFNTASRLYVIDRNGKDVAPFPIDLPEKASAGLNVFDYEGKRDYRVLIPTEEARLLNFTLEGRPVDGWTPPNTPATCSLPVQHLRIGGKDHLVLVDNAGRVSVLDRRGEKRYDAKARITGAASWIGLRPALDIGSCAVLWTDSANNALATSFDGSTDTLCVDGSGRLILTEQANGGLAITLTKEGKTSTVQGAVPFVRAPSVLAGEKRSRSLDINLDGRIESIEVYHDGRVLALDRTP